MQMKSLAIVFHLRFCSSFRYTVANLPGMICIFSLIDEKSRGGELEWNIINRLFYQIPWNRRPWTTSHGKGIALSSWWIWLRTEHSPRRSTFSIRWTITQTNFWFPNWGPTLTGGFWETKTTSWSGGWNTERTTKNLPSRRVSARWFWTPSMISSSKF